MSATNYLLLLLPSLLCVALLATLLILQHRQSAATERGLIDRLMVKEGFEPLEYRQEVEPVTVETAEKLNQAIQALRRKKASSHSVKFTIPGAGLPMAGMGDLVKK